MESIKVINRFKILIAMNIYSLCIVDEAMSKSELDQIAATFIPSGTNYQWHFIPQVELIKEIEGVDNGG